MVEAQTKQTYQRNYPYNFRMYSFNPFGDSYLLKPHDTTWKDGIIALEAGTRYHFLPITLTQSLGSAQGALSRLLQENPLLFESPDKVAPNRFSASEIYSFVRSVP